MLAFRVDRARLDSRLPDGWRSVDHAGFGNVVAGFCEVLLYQDADGQPIGGARRFYVPVNGTATHGLAAAEANFRYATFADGPDPFPGCSATMCTVEHRLSFETDGPRSTCSEYHRYVGDAETLLELSLSYDRGRLERGSGEMAVRCPDDPSIVLTYWNDEPQDVVYSAEDGVDRRKDFGYVLRSPVLADIFDGSERLIAVVAVPTSERRVFSG